jgi:hypothetical protein
VLQLPGLDEQVAAFGASSRPASPTGVERWSSASWDSARVAAGGHALRIVVTDARISALPAR